MPKPTETRMCTELGRALRFDGRGLHHLALKWYKRALDLTKYSNAPSPEKEARLKQAIEFQIREVLRLIEEPVRIRPVLKAKL